MTMSENGSSSCMRRISSTGMSAAPVTASRSVERSYASRSGWSRIDWYTVGGPGNTVTDSSATVRRRSSTSNTGFGMMVAPRMSDARQPALYPNMWKNGFTIRYRSPSTSPAMSHQSENCRSVCACVMSTPFGAPVVPDVNSTSLTSSPPTAPMRASTVASSTASPVARNSVSDWSAALPSSKPTTVATFGSCDRRPAIVAA